MYITEFLMHFYCIHKRICIASKLSSNFILTCVSYLCFLFYLCFDCFIACAFSNISSKFLRFPYFAIYYIHNNDVVSASNNLVICTTFHSSHYLINHFSNKYFIFVLSSFNSNYLVDYFGGGANR